MKTVRVRGGAYCRRGEGKNAHTVRKERKKGEKRRTINEGTTLYLHSAYLSLEMGIQFLLPLMHSKNSNSNEVQME